MDRISEKKALKEFAEYLKSKKGLKRALEGAKEKYRSIGNIGGTIVLEKLSSEEREDLTAFLREDFMDKKRVSIKIEKFQNALCGTRFEKLGFKDVLFEYFHEDILTKKEEKKIFDDEKGRFFEAFIFDFDGTKAGEWLENLLREGANAYKTIMQNYNLDREKLGKTLKQVFTAYNRLPYRENKRELLSIFSSNMTKNPHSFDEGTLQFNLLMYALMHEFQAKKPNNLEERAELLYGAGIIKDDVSNFTMCLGLIGYKDGVAHEGWKGFSESFEPFCPTVWNLNCVDKIESCCGKVFVFENPSIYRSISERLKGKQISVVCTNGQLRLADIMLLDMLTDSLIYYSGDFDPEGILIADKLKKRYGDRLKLWHYEVQDYKKCLSDEVLDEARIRKLKNVESLELMGVANEIRSLKRAGYQEMLLGVYCDEILQKNASLVTLKQ